jgi:hypothetical protein
MSLSAAIQRSYRYFLPPLLMSPRRLVRHLYGPAMFYVVGMLTGECLYAQPDQVVHITGRGVLAIIGLMWLRSWAGKSPGSPGA